MNTEWVITTNTETQRSLHKTQCKESSEAAIKQAVDNSLEKAIHLLHKNIQDDSLYFLVEWHNHSTLTIVVTDDMKQETAPEVVCCELLITEDKKEYYAERIHFWARDYLTTSGGFIQYSLVAVFGFGDRNKAELL
jgi:predicted nuclease of restriction endonuclease-like RecB superfamily